MACEPGCAACRCLRLAALQIIGGRGIEALTLDRAAALAGLPLPVAREHYESPFVCLCATYDVLASELVAEIEAAFEDATDWQTAFARSLCELLERIAASRGEARLAFIEVARGDRVLRHRRDLVRRRLVTFLLCEYERLHPDEEPLPAMQVEMLVGSAFHTIAGEVAAGRTADLPELGPRLVQATGCFIPERV